MHLSLALFLLLSLSAISSKTEEFAIESNAEPLIEEVVEGGGEVRLGVEHHFSCAVLGGTQELDPSAIHGVTQMPC